MSCGRERISFSKSVTPLGGRRPARYRSTIWFLMMNSRSIAGAGVPGAAAPAAGALVHTRGFDTTRSFHRGSKFRRFRAERTARVSKPMRTRRKKARRHSGWYLPLVLQDRTRLCCDSYVRKPLRRFTFREWVPGNPATWFAVCPRMRLDRPRTATVSVHVLPSRFDCP